MPSMLAPEDLPGQHARVMRVAPSSTPAPPRQPSPDITPVVAPPSTTTEKVDKYSDDYASSSDEEEPISRQQKEDDGWGVVQSKKKSTSYPTPPYNSVWA